MLPYIIAEIDGLDIINGKIQTIDAPPKLPDGVTEVVFENYDTISNNNNWTSYTIPNGENLHFQKMEFGASQSTYGCVLELWYDSNGQTSPPNTSLMTLLKPIFVNGENCYIWFDQSGYITGNGTRKIWLNRRKFASGLIVIYYKLFAYLES